MIVRARAPLRMSFAGDATDVPPYVDEAGGLILSATIDKFVHASVTPQEEVNGKDTGHVSSSDVLHIGEELKIYRGEELIRASVKRMGLPERPVDIIVHSDAPAGSGFGSTSTTVVAVLGALMEFTRQPLDKYELAEMAYRVEREDVGIPGGKQDHYMAVFGGFDYIEFMNGRAVVNKLKIKTEIANELQYSLLLCHTGSIESSGRILTDQMKDHSQIKDRLDHLKELTVKMKNHLLRGELGKFGKTMHEVWMVKRELSTHISSDRIDRMYNVARDHGALGGRVLGAGGGGYLLLFCDFEKKHIIGEKLEEMGGKLVDFEFEYNGLRSWRVRQKHERMEDGA